MVRRVVDASATQGCALRRFYKGLARATPTMTQALHLRLRFQAQLPMIAERSFELRH